MPFFQAKRLSALALALILTAFLLLSPLLDVYGVHDHSCSANKCILCLASCAISILKDLFILAVISAAAILITLPLRISFSRIVTATAASPVSLKTKITS